MITHLTPGSRTALLAAAALVTTMTALSAAATRYCPSGFEQGTTPCGPIRGIDACTYNSTDETYECISAFGQYADTIYAVSDGDETSGTAAMWGYIGTGAGGVKFCCEFTGGNFPIRIETKAGADEIYLISGEQNYQNTSVIFAGDGGDYVKGSNWAGCSYPCDDINVGESGTEDPDEVDAGGGDDKILAPASDIYNNIFEGDGGDDVIFGGPYTDYIGGGDGDDVIRGGEGDDFLDGDAGEDKIHGNGGADTIDGGTGLDTLCGGPGTVDTIDGGTENPQPYNKCAEDDEDTMTNCLDQYETCPGYPW